MDPELGGIWEAPATVATPAASLGVERLLGRSTLGSREAGRFLTLAAGCICTMVQHVQERRWYQSTVAWFGQIWGYSGGGVSGVTCEQITCVHAAGQNGHDLINESHDRYNNT